MDVAINKKLKPFATEKARYKIAYGGRGSGKSWGLARIFLLMAAQSEEPLRVLCCREIQDSIKDSVHKLLKDQIDTLGLSGFTVQNDVIRHSNGSEFLFKGLYTNLSKIKSIEGITHVWIEEAESISAMSWEILDPTIRKPGSEIWVSFNPRYEDDIIYKTFVIDPPENSIVIKVNYQDNKHFPKELEDQKTHMARVDPDLYLHIWEGELKRNTAEQVMQSKWSVEDFETLPLEHFYYGADWGFSQDPNTVNRCFIAPHPEWGENCLYLDYEVNDRPYEQEERITSSDLEELPALWNTMPRIRKHNVQADSARPETISFMKNKGFVVESVSKWPGSVEDGVTHLRSYDKIIINPRCKNTIFEFKSYKYKVDKKSGQITSIILDKFNHHMDAIRYALVPIMKTNNYDYSSML